jgi:hypothetical protein
MFFFYLQDVTLYFVVEWCQFVRKRRGSDTNLRNILFPRVTLRFRYNLLSLRCLGRKGSALFMDILCIQHRKGVWFLQMSLICLPPLFWFRLSIFCSIFSYFSSHSYLSCPSRSSFTTFFTPLPASTPLPPLLCLLFLSLSSFFLPLSCSWK